MNSSKIRKDIVLKKTRELLNNNETEEYFNKLRESTTNTERTHIISQYNYLKLTKEEEIELLNIVAEKEEEEYNIQQFNELNFTEEEKVLYKKELTDYNIRHEKQKREEIQLEETSNIQIDKNFLKREIENYNKSEVLTVKDDWMYLFNRISKNNEVIGKILFHSFWGQALQHIEVYDGEGKKINLKIDFTCIQNSGTGKGESIDEFFIPVITEFEYEFFDEESTQTLTKKLTYVRGKGQSTLAGLLNRFKRKTSGKGYTTQVIKGPIATNNFLIYTEANDLLDPTTYNQKWIDALLDILEGKPYEAHLEKYDLPITTQSNISLISTSRPIKGLDFYFIKSGLINRNLTYMRNLSPKQMRNMQQKFNLKSFGRRENKVSYEIEIKVLCKKLLDVYNWSTKFIGKEYPTINPQILNKLVDMKLEEISIDIQSDVKLQQYQEILSEYNSRLRNKLVSLSYHNAITRKNKLEVQDVLQAFDLLKNDCYTNLKYWLIENVVIDKKITERDREIYRVVKRILENSPNNICTVSELRTSIEQNERINIGGTYIYKKLQQLIDTRGDTFIKVDKRHIKLVGGKKK